MAQPFVWPPPGFAELPVEEQIDYVQALWDEIVDKGQVPLPDWHRELIRERLAEPRSAQGRSWHEVRAELERKYPGSR